MVEFLQKLSDKLGATAEHLWQVLIRQAPIDGAVSILQYAAIVITCIWWVKFIKKATKNVETHKWDDIIYLPIGIVTVGLIVLALCAFFDIPNTAAAFFNPEYWALQKLLNRT